MIFFSKLYSGNINEFNKFIENNNLPVNIKNNNNENALHVIIKSDLSDILKINFIKYLNSKNININDKDCNGNSPFNLACQKQLFNIMIVLYNLYKNEINLYDKNNYDINPIYYILKGEIVDELEDYPSPEKFIKNESILKINDLSKLNDEIKSFVNNKNIFNNDKLIKIIKENAKFELGTNKLLIDEKIDQFKNKIIENKNNLSSDIKSQFNNEILNILKKSHPKIFEPINFESTKSFDNDGFYYLKEGETKTNYKIHGEPTFDENLEIIKKNNKIEIENYKNKYKQIINSLDPISFHFDFLENIAHVYYCSEFSKNIKKLLENEKCNAIPDKYLNPRNAIPSFIDFINNQAKPEEKDKKSDKYIIGNNKLFNNFIIQIDDLHKACKSSEFIYIKNIVTNQEIFIYKNNDDKGINLYQSRTFNGGNIDNDRRLALEIEVKDSLLELKLNNKSLGIGQFEIEFYKYDKTDPNQFKFIDKIDIKTNEYNESIEDFFTNKIKLQEGSGNNPKLNNFFDNFSVPGKADEPDDREDEIYDRENFSTVNEIDDNDKLDKDNDEKEYMKIDNDDRDIKIYNDNNHLIYHYPMFYPEKEFEKDEEDEDEIYFDFDKPHILRPAKIYNTLNRYYNFIIIKNKSKIKIENELKNLTSYIFLNKTEKKEIILLGISHYIGNYSPYRVIELSNDFKEYQSFQSYTEIIYDNINYYMQIDRNEYIVHNKKMSLRNNDIDPFFNIKIDISPIINKFNNNLINYNEDQSISEKAYYKMNGHFSFYFGNGIIELSYVNFLLAKLHFRFENENQIVDRLEFETNYKISTIYQMFKNIIEEKKLNYENALIVIKKYEHIEFKSSFNEIKEILDIFYDKNIKLHVAEENKQKDKFGQEGGSQDDFEQIYFFTHRNPKIINNNKYYTIFNLFLDEFLNESQKNENISFNFMIEDIDEIKKKINMDPYSFRDKISTHQNLFKINRFKDISYLKIVFFDNNNINNNFSDFCNFENLLNKNYLEDINYSYFYTFRNFEANEITEKSNVSFFDTFPLIKFNHEKKLTTIICSKKIYIWKKICTEEECKQIFEETEITITDTNFPDYQFNYIFDKNNIQITDIKFKYNEIIKNNEEKIIEENSIINRNGYFDVEEDLNQYNNDERMGIYKILMKIIKEIIIIIMNELPYNNLTLNDNLSIILQELIEELSKPQNGGYFNKYIKYKKKYLNINFSNYDFKKEYIKNGIDYKTKYLKYKKKYLNNEK